jgi:hypothetical protein
MLTGTVDTWRSDYIVKMVYIDSELAKLDTGLDAYVKDTLMPYIQTYL